MRSGRLFLAIALLATPAASEEIFADRTAEAGIDFQHFNGMSGELYYSEIMGAGGAVLDYDGDGDYDLYFVQGCMLGGKDLDEALLDGPVQRPLKDRLYRNDLKVGADGGARLRFTDVTAEAQIDAGGYGMGVATGDYDNDGHVDFYVTNFGSNQLWRNRGDGTFEDVTQKAGVDDPSWSLAATFLDYDGDGRLDLYVGNYVDFKESGNKRCPAPTGEPDYCGPLGFDPLPDRLFRNRGDGTFEDVTARAGLGEPRNGMGVITSDFDGNGWIDLYVANDAMANQLWLNQGDGTFVDDALLAGCAFNLDGRPEGSMGIAAGDVDGDGREDLLVTHLVRETNTLYLNRGDASFLDATQKSGLGPPGWLYTSFGVALFDYDNDGWLDVLVTNGAVQNYDRELFAPGEGPRRGEEPPIATWRLQQPNQLYHNVDGRFEEVSATAGEVFRHSEVSRGVNIGDLDNDGDLDAVVHNNHGPARLLVNQVGQRRNWLGVRLVGGEGRPRDMLGAQAGVERGGRLVWRRVRTDGSYASAQDPRLLFPLDDGTREAVVRVIWPGGRTEEFSGVEARRYTTLREGSGRPGGA